MARAESVHRVRLDRERIERLLADASAAWERVGEFQAKERLWLEQVQSSRRSEIAAWEEMAKPPPVDVLLFCPRCHAQHIDAPEVGTGWANPPHKSHLCHQCGTVWRPADVPTNGVAAIATRGERDTWELTPPWPKSSGANVK